MEWRVGDCRVMRLLLPTPFPVGPVNAYLIMGQGVTLVDTGPKTPEALQAMDEGLKRAGIGWRDIDRILLTHHHIDHMGLAMEIVGRSGARVLAHPLAGPALAVRDEYKARYEGFYNRLYRSHGAPEEAIFGAIRYLERVKEKMDPIPDIDAVEEGAPLPGETGWQVLFVPGHTQNHIALWQEKEGVLIAGDFLLPDISSNAFVEPPPAGAERAKPLLQYRQSLERVRAMAVSLVLPAHGGAFRTPQALIDHRLKRQEERAEQIFALLQKGPRTAYEVSAELFPKNHLKEMALTLSETLGHLDLLVEGGRVREEQRAGRSLFSVV